MILSLKVLEEVLLVSFSQGWSWCRGCVRVGVSCTRKGPLASFWQLLEGALFE